MATALILLPWWVGSSAAVASGQCRPASGDFDNDGYGDYVVGVPLRNVSGVANAGAITVVYGVPQGLSGRDQYFHQNTGGIGSVAERADRFGDAVVAGNFNGDAFTDLAVGVPGENGGRGMIHIFYGSATGLRARSDQRITMGASGIPGAGPSAGDRFGAALTAGDFDNDGKDDLAVGAPGDDTGASNAGSVIVLNGAAPKLTTSGAKRFYQSSVGDAAEANARFGGELVACDFDGDTRDDLAIGIPLEDHAGRSDAGAVGVLYGSGTGLATSDADFFRQNDVGGTHEANGRFGHALAATDIDGGGHGDLIVGAPNANHPPVGPEPAVIDAGAIFIVQGSGTGLNLAGAVERFQPNGVPNPKSGPDKADRFGWSLAAADLNNDGHGDVAVGVPFEDYNRNTSNLGEVNLLFGTSGGTLGTTFLIRQGYGGVAGTAEAGDRFGEVLAVGDFGGMTFNNDPVFDLAIGVPQEDDGRLNAAGSTHVIFGAGGVSVPGPAKLDYGTARITGSPAKADKFGWAITG